MPDVTYHTKMTREESIANTKKVCEQNGIEYRARLPLKDLKKLVTRYWGFYHDFEAQPDAQAEVEMLMGRGHSEKKAFEISLIRRMRATKKGLSPEFVG
jgi:hypothetical protein